MVEINLRTLGLETDVVNVDENLHINDLKNAIEQKLGPDFYSAQHQILILRGQNITSFEEKLADLEMKDSDSIIVIGYKAREPAILRKPNETEKTNLNNQSKKNSVPDPKIIAQLSEFGFDQKDILKALEQTNDIEIATEIILNSSKNKPIENFNQVGQSKDEKSESYKNIKKVLDSVDISSLVQQSRETNQTILELICNELFTSNSDGLKLLLQDHETFNQVYTDILKSLNIDDTNVELGEGIDFLGELGDEEAGMEDFVNMDNDDQIITAELSEEDQIIIKNLSDLGFSKEKSTIAYLACNKNAEHAAQFLLSEGNDDDDLPLN